MLAALIAEAFAIRSLLYHAICGGLSALVSLVTIGALDKDYDLCDEPLIAVGAGIAAGFAYWRWPAGAPASGGRCSRQAPPELQPLPPPAGPPPLPPPAP